MTKEDRAKLPGKESTKKRHEMTPEELGQHLIFKRAYDRIYRAWRRDSDTGLVEYQAKYHQIHRIMHPEESRARDKENYRKNPETMKKHERKRRAQKAEVENHPYTANDVVAVWGIICYICNQEIDLTAPRHSRGGDGWEKGLHLDHVIPIAVGGPDTIDNVKPTHAICNLRRPKTLDLDFLQGIPKDQIARIKKFKKELRQAKPGRPLKD